MNNYIYLNNTDLIKIKLTFDTISKIKSLPICNLYDIYKKLNDDLIWINKYVFGYDNQHPYVDYVFDYFIDNFDLIENNQELKQINKPREYYYVNFEESELKFKTLFQQTIFNSSDQTPCMKWHFEQERIICSIGDALIQIIGNSTTVSYKDNYIGGWRDCLIISSLPHSIINKKKKSKL